VDIDETAVAAAFAQPDIDGRFSGPLGDYLRIAGHRRPVLFFAFPPKAAGTFLRAAAIEAVGGSLVRGVHAQGGRDAQPYLPVFLQYYLGGLCAGPMVVHAHMQALPANRHFLEALGIRPVIMLRPIPDMLASYCDMLSASADPAIDGLNCPIPAAFATLPHAEKAGYLIDVVAPWYAGYFATWRDYARDCPDEVCILRYADFLADAAAVLEAALRHADLPRSRAVCRSAVDGVWRERAAQRFNKGVMGRGAAYFTPAHRARLDALLGHFPELAPWREDLLPAAAMSSGAAAD